MVAACRNVIIKIRRRVMHQGRKLGCEDAEGVDSYRISSVVAACRNVIHMGKLKALVQNNQENHFGAHYMVSKTG